MKLFQALDESDVAALRGRTPVRVILEFLAELRQAGAATATAEA